MKARERENTIFNQELKTFLLQPNVEFVIDFLSSKLENTFLFKYVITNSSKNIHLKFKKLLTEYM